MAMAMAVAVVAVVVMVAAIMRGEDEGVIIERRQQNEEVTFWNNPFSVNQGGRGQLPFFIDLKLRYYTNCDLLYNRCSLCLDKVAI